MNTIQTKPKKNKKPKETSHISTRNKS